MAFISTIDVIGSGFTAQQLRLDIVSENIVNMNTTRTENGEGPYRRKTVVFEAENRRSRFQEAMARAQYGMTGRTARTQGGVRVVAVGEDPSDFKLKYDPDDPDANEDGYVELPNVDLVKEVADAMAASQAYSADVTAFNLLKNVVSSALEIGR